MSEIIASIIFFLVYVYMIYICTRKYNPFDKYEDEDDELKKLEDLDIKTEPSGSITQKNKDFFD